MKKRQLPIVFMAITILVITLFQSWWIRNRYMEELHAMDLITNISFRESIYELQGARLNLDSSYREVRDGNRVPHMGKRTDMSTMMEVISSRVRDSSHPMPIGNTTVGIVNDYLK